VAILVISLSSIVSSFYYLAGQTLEVSISNWLLDSHGHYDAMPLLMVY